MSNKYQSQPFENARTKIQSIYTAANEQAADQLLASARCYVDTLEEYKQISAHQRMVLDDELAIAHHNWRTPPRHGAFMARIRIELKLALASCKVWLAVKEQKWKRYWLKWVARMAIVCLIVTFGMVPFFGIAISIGYLVTAGGLLLVAFSLLVRFKFLQDLATLLGVVLAGYWYIHSVSGALNPVDQVILSTEPNDGYFALVKVVRGEDGQKQDCSFDPTNATLTCRVRVGQNTADLTTQP